MRKIYFTLSVFFLIQFSFSQSLDWAKQLGGTGADGGNAIALDGLSNVYTTGTFVATADFDPGIGTSTFTSNGAEDIYISKLDVNGNFVWAKQVGGSGSDVAKDIASDASGNTYIIGWFNGTVDFDPGPGTFNASAAGTAAFILKLDAAGNFVWMYQFGGNPSTAAFGYAINLDGIGNIVLTGEFNGTVDFNPYVAVHNLTSAPASLNIFFVMIDVAGNNCPLVGLLPPGRGYDIAMDASGYLYCTGYFSGTGDFDPGPGTVNKTSAGGTDGFICIFTPTGTFYKFHQIGGPGNEESYSVVVDASGNIFSTGFFSNTCNFCYGAGTCTMTSSGAGDIYVMKHNTIGYVWVKQVTSNIFGTDVGRSIALDASNNIYVAGTYAGMPADFDPGPGTFALSSIGGTTSFILELDPSGNFITAKDISCTGISVANSIAIDASGSVYTTGSFNYTGDFEPDVLTYTMTSNGSGSYDAYIQKLNICVAPPTPTNTTAPANLVICKYGSTTLNANGTGTLNWFTTPTGTVNVNTGTTFNTPTLSTNTTYYVESTTCGPSITRTPITVTVNPTPNIIVNSGGICIGNSFTITASGALTYTFSSGTSVVSPTANTTYSITGTNSFGCVSPTVAISSVTVNPLPTITVNSGSVCLGNSFVMIPTGASTYTFSSGSATVSPVVNSSYSVTGTSTAGCVSSSPAISNLTVNPNPTVTVNSGVICNGDSFTMTPNGASTYTFSSGTSVVSPTTNVTYSITGTDSFGCTGFAISNVTVNPAPSLTITGTNSICAGSTLNLIVNGASTYTWSTGSTAGSIFVSPATNTVYSVNGTNSFGCQNTQSISITVNPNPTVTISTPSATCAGSMGCLSASGALNYAWSGPCGFSSSLQSPCFPFSGFCLCSYSVVGSVGTCTGTATVCLSVISPPGISASTSSSVLCIGQTATITATGGSATYTWNTSATGSATAVSPTITTTYTVIGTAANGCTNGTSITQTVSTCAGIANSGIIINEIRIFPNPSSGELNIQSQVNLRSIKIFGVDGKLILEKVITTNAMIQTLNISELKSGIYFVNCATEEKEIYFKVVKE